MLPKPIERLKKCLEKDSKASHSGGHGDIASKQSLKPPPEASSLSSNTPRPSDVVSGHQLCVVTGAARESRRAWVQSIKEQEQRGKGKEEVPWPTLIYLSCYHVFCTEHEQWLVMLSEKNSSRQRKKPLTVKESAKRQEPKRSRPSEVPIIWLAGVGWGDGGVGHLPSSSHSGESGLATPLLLHKGQQREGAWGDWTSQGNTMRLSKLLCVLNILRCRHCLHQFIHFFFWYSLNYFHVPHLNFPYATWGHTQPNQRWFQQCVSNASLIPQPSQSFFRILSNSTSIFPVIPQIFPARLWGFPGTMLARHWS